CVRDAGMGYSGYSFW
nr:immunoglobulin heavy chain junction region [Macaca mulatta]